MKKIEKIGTIDRFDKLILSSFNKIKKHDFNGEDNDFYNLFIGAGVKKPIEYLIKLVNKYPNYKIKNMDETYEIIDFFNFELYDSKDLYSLGGKELFTKLINRGLSGQVKRDKYGDLNYPTNFNPAELFDTYIGWKFKILENSAWGNLWETFEDLPAIKLVPTILEHTENGFNCEKYYNFRIGCILNNTWSEDQVYKDIKNEVLEMAKKQKLSIFVKKEDAFFVKKSDLKYFKDSKEYKLIEN